MKNKDKRINCQNNNKQQIKMSSNSQQQWSIMNGSFALIWYYWFKKYMARKNKKVNVPQQIQNMKQKYKIEAIESYQNSTIIRQKIQQIKEKTRSSSPLNLQSSLSATTNNTNISMPLFYTINPQVQAKQIEQIIMSDLQQSDNSEYKELLNELHSYYLNNKCIYIIYKIEKDTNLQETVSKLLNSSCYEGSISLKNSKINLSSIANQEDSLLADRNDSLLDSYDKMEDRIDNLEMIGKFADIEGLQIWNIKYYNIPHCFIKIKKNSWAKCLGEITSQPSAANYTKIIHPSQPKSISSLPIIPRIKKYRPSIDNLQPFISYMQILWSKWPHMGPICQSIFQYNGLPYIFTQDYRQQSIAVLCYFIVFGNQQRNLTQKYVNRWMDNNPNSTLTKTIKYMRDVVKDKNMPNSSNQVIIKGLFDQGDPIW